MFKKGFQLHVASKTFGKIISISFAQRSNERISIFSTNFSVDIAMSVIKSRLLGHCCSPMKCSTTPRRPPARIALEARPIPHQREIPALPARLALVALRLRLGALFGGEGFCLGAGFGP